MATKWARHSATNENLLAHAVEPVMRWLIAVALTGDTMTYGDVKHMLEREADFSTVFTTRIGFVAGALMERILAVEPDAPLINVLVVNQVDRQPSKGAGGFMATRFDEPKLAQPKAKTNHSALWKASFNRAAGEVYAYTADDWSQLYQRVFKKRLPKKSIADLEDERQEGSENDGLPPAGRKYGPGGEGPFHKALRLWVTQNPGRVRAAFAGARTKTEFDLYSGDRVDAVYFCTDRTIVLEVKGRSSDIVDLRRGVFQCIKYRAVKKAMDVRPNAQVDAFLVTEKKLPGEIAALLRLHRIHHFQAPMKRD